MMYTECHKENIVKLPTQNISVDDEVAKAISTALIQLGIYPCNVGYKYLKDAIRMSVESDSALFVTKEIYPKIGKRYSVPWVRIERGIRYSISKMKADDAKKSMYLGVVKDNYTNKEFISLVAEYIRFN